MMTQSQGSVRLFHQPDGGQIQVDNGIIALDSGLESAVYLSLFGGNEDDDGRVDSMVQWWGNWSETDPALAYRSRTQNIIDSLPATSGNLKRLEDAVSFDLAWMIPDVASEITASIRLVSSKRVDIAVSVLAIGGREDFKYSVNWEATK